MTELGFVAHYLILNLISYPNFIAVTNTLLLFEIY